MVPENEGSKFSLLLLKFTADLGIWFDSILQFAKIRCIHKGDFYSHLCGYNF